MTDVAEKFAALRERYPEDIERIKADEQRVTELLQKREFYAFPTTQALLDLCRKDVLFARRALATDRRLGEDGRRELWAIIDARQWFIERVAQDYGAELDAIDQELQAELSVR